jgi:hypothetical protein
MLLMSLEAPAMTALIARFEHPEISLAAWGGIVLPVVLLFEGPIIMILAASTALSRDWPSYGGLRRFMNVFSASLTAVHLIIAATPLYWVVTQGLLGAPPETVGPARIGLLLMLPWTWCIAYRRFIQGVLIRLGRSLWIGLGTVVRLIAEVVVLLIGYKTRALSGIAVASIALSLGVASEAVFVALAGRKPLRMQLRPSPIAGPALSARQLLRFYLPLSLTTMLSMVCTPIGSAVMGRMPLALVSLAGWPVVIAVTFAVRGTGFAYNEVVVSLLDRHGSVRRLWHFALILSAVTTVCLGLLLVPKIADLVFERVLNLPGSVSTLVRRSLWLTIPLPATAALQSWYQGVLLSVRATQPIMESMLVFLLVLSLTLGIGLAVGGFAGLYLAVGALTAGEVLRTVWLWWRSQGALRSLATERARDVRAVSL